eukprot:285869-Pyramimonas_sp.AAC.1
MAAATSSADGDGRPRRMSAATVATAESETRKSDSHLKDSFFFSYEVGVANSLQIPACYPHLPHSSAMLVILISD